jgi:two-component system response regulator
MDTRAVVLIEDNPSDADLAKRVFKKMGVNNPIIHLEDGLDAINYFHNQDNSIIDSPSPALILLDLKLPIIDGIEVLRRLRSNEKTKHFIIVVLSSSVEETDIQTTYDLGVNSYIKKPVDLQHFTEVMQQIWQYWLETNVSVKN